MDLKVFVIIVTYKGKQWYDRCFTSLRESTIPVQTIVVDNASEDGSVEYIREHYPEIVLMENKENLGFGQANNLAMRYALDHDCDYVFLLNQDTWIEPDSIEKLVKVHQQYPEYGILSPMHLRADRRSLYIQIEDGRLDHGNKMLSDFYFQTIEDVYRVSYVNAAAWLLPRTTLMTIGGFDPMFIHYSEDDDYINRVNYHGLKIGVCPHSRIVHDHQNVMNPLTPKGSRNRRNQQILLRFSNINQMESVFAYRSFLIRKMIGSLLKGNASEARNYYEDYRFVRKQKKRIIQSRILKTEKQPLWIGKE